MKNKLIAFMFLFLVSLGVVTVSGAVNVDSCINLTSANTEYVLINNISSTGNCINVTANNITLDGAGYTILYANTPGITNKYAITGHGVNDFTLKNTRIEEAYNVSVTNLNIALNFYNSNNLYIFNNTILTKTYASHGIKIHAGSDHARIINNTITTSKIDADANGILISESINATLIGNKIFTPKSPALDIHASNINQANHSIDTSNLVEGLPINYTFDLSGIINGQDFTPFGQVIFGYAHNLNITSSNFSTDGLAISFSNNLILENNLINTGNSTGINAYRLTNSTIRYNTIVANESSAIFLRTSSTNNDIHNNNLTSNGFKGYGIYLYSTNSNRIFNNTILSTGTDARGIYLDIASYNNISENNITISSSATRNNYGINLYSNAQNNLIKQNIINNQATSGGVGIQLKLNSNNNYISNLNILNSSISIYMDTVYNNYFDNLDFVFRTRQWRYPKEANNTEFLTNSNLNYIVENIPADTNLNTNYPFHSNASNSDILNNTLTQNLKIQFHSLSNALIYYSNNSIAGSSDINSNDGNINITLTPNNYSYVLDNFNLTEGVSREHSPIWFSYSSSTLKKIASNLTESIYSNVLVNVDSCNIFKVSYTPEGESSISPSYSCNNNLLTLTEIKVNPAESSNIIEITYKTQKTDFCEDIINIFTSAVGIITILIIIIMLSIGLSVLGIIEFSNVNLVEAIIIFVNSFIIVAVGIFIIIKLIGC